jgi:hypothetical protein
MMMLVVHWCSQLKTGTTFERGGYQLVAVKVTQYALPEVKVGTVMMAEEPLPVTGVGGTSCVKTDATDEL